MMFKVNDKVRVISNGKTFPNYNEGAELLGATNWIQNLIIDDDECGVITSAITDPQCGVDNINLFTRDSDGAQVVIGDDGLGLIERPMTDLTKLDTPFGELDRSVQLALVEYVLDGGECEYRETDNIYWTCNESVLRRKLLCFCDGRIYRAVPAEPTEPTELEKLETESSSLLEQMKKLDDRIKSIKGGA